MGDYCCGFGHRFWGYDPAEIGEIIKNLIERKNISIFMTGGMGNFDAAFSSAVRRAKRSHPEVRLWLIKPYFSNELNTSREYYQDMYDDVIIPPELAGVHYKTAIGLRNRWMVDRCGVILSGVHRDFGGAFAAINYAQKRGKIIVKVGTK